MTYNAGQFQNIVKHVPKVPRWLILGGPADGNEAQCAVTRWPGLKVLGIEPSEPMRIWQRANGWPKGAPLLPYALTDHCGQAVMHAPDDDPRCSSLLSERHGPLVEVPTVTIDSLNQQYGPFRRAILWLDIEGMEYEALQGARELFALGEVLLVNVEILERRQDATKRIHSLLTGRGFRLATLWNYHPGSHHDRIYVPGRTA